MINVERFLTERGISVTRVRDNRKRDVVQLNLANTSLTELRRMGFRVCRSPGNSQFLLYYKGNFCGVVV